MQVASERASHFGACWNRLGGVGRSRPSQQGVGTVPSTKKIGNASVQRYEQIVEKLRDDVAKLSNQQPQHPTLRTPR